MSEASMSPEQVVLIMAGRWCDVCKMELGMGLCERCYCVSAKGMPNSILSVVVQRGGMPYLVKKP